MNESRDQVDSLDQNFWCDLFDYSSLLDDALPPADVYWKLHPNAERAGVSLDALLGGTPSQATASNVKEDQEFPRKSAGVSLDVSHSGTTSQASECAEEQECRKKRGRTDSRCGTGTKACREKMRREKLNDRFSELSATLEPGRPVKIDKLAILGDAIRILNELRSESQEYKDMNEKLLEEIKTLKAEKNELREEKMALKTEKEKIEQQIKGMPALSLPPANFMAAHPPMYSTGANKMPMFPSYGLVPMWQYLSPSARDTSQDHELRPPAA
ncbi:transcription factor ILR3-like [Andrographis paniculata]|uniref:transcription factor ILR3-like n=1 Tax=Andrographis paniculata TaxID=175694 RepID=UPI0021E894AA|nr:transcription factor ILR3-like [Andrographis paniculata]